jgi:membrane fusion protein (multidrug efflux system)
VRRMSTLVLLPLMALFGSSVAAGCQSGEPEVGEAEAAKPAEQQEGQPAQAAPARLTVKVAAPTKRTVQRTGRGQGALFAHETVILSNKQAGYVSKMLVDFGDKVTRGQTLGQMEREELSLQVDIAESSVKQAEAMYMRAKAENERMQQLFAEQIIPPQKRDIAEAEYKVAAAQVHTAKKALDLAKKRLRDTRIVSPVKGFVQERFANPGEYKTAASKLFEVVVVNPLKLRAPVPERFAAVAQIGMLLRVEVEALPGEVFEGKLTRMAAQVDHKTRTLLIEAQIPNANKKLRPGYFAHITGVLGEEEALFIPRIGVSRFAGVERVFVVKDNVVTSREVTSGMEDGEWIEIAQGLAEGESVAVSSLNRLADGMAVHVQFTEAHVE